MKEQNNQLTIFIINLDLKNTNTNQNKITITSALLVHDTKGIDRCHLIETPCKIFTMSDPTTK